MGTQKEVKKTQVHDDEAIDLWTYILRERWQWSDPLADIISDTEQFLIYLRGIEAKTSNKEVAS